MEGIESWAADIERDAQQQRARNVGGRPAKGYNARGNHKLECPSCGFACRCSVASFNRAGALPTCGCGSTMAVPVLRDRAALLPADLEAELQTMSREEFVRTCRELGWRDLLRADTPRKGNMDRGIRHTCQWPGGYCNVIVDGEFCTEHDPATAALERRARLAAA